MRKLEFSVLYIGLLTTILIVSAITQKANAQVPSRQEDLENLDSLKKAAMLKVETDYTVPSFTCLKRAIVTAGTASVAEKAKALKNGLNNLQPKGMPYSIVMNINEDPASKMAFTWFSNGGIFDGKVQIIHGIAKNQKQFEKPLKTVNAKVSPVNDLNYCVKSNGLLSLAGLTDNSKRNYMSNKAIVTGLKSNSIYSFRVGNEGNWSNIGTFNTAPRNRTDFSFIYTTDPQANNDEMFNISQTTTHAAQKMYPDASFWLSCGDMVQSSGNLNSEWEWEQFFFTQQDLFLHIPFAPVLGNHDKSINRNFTSHFYTDTTDFDFKLSTTPGSVYSFVYGNALFIAMSFEDFDKPGYIESLAKWMRTKISEHPDLKWRIAYYHKTIYTGSSHQDDSDGMIIRDRFAPLFDSLKIDLALQGHDHVYEVIGPVKGKQLVPYAVTNQVLLPVNSREMVTGRQNGVLSVKEGTLYFLNNSAGKKKYEPKSKEKMDLTENRLGLKNYFGLFTGRFGQTGRPTFSNIKVSRDTITISTFEVFDEGTVSLFDKIKIVK